MTTSIFNDQDFVNDKKKGPEIKNIYLNFDDESNNNTKTPEQKQKKYKELEKNEINVNVLFEQPIIKHKNYIMSIILIIIICLCLYILYINATVDNISGSWILINKKPLMAHVNQNRYMNNIKIIYTNGDKIIKKCKGHLKGKILRLCTGDVGTVRNNTIIWDNDIKWVKINV